MGHISKVLQTGFGLAIAATAGALLLYKKNPKLRRKTKVWAEEMKKEIQESLSEFKIVNQATYKKVVGQVGERYGRLKDVNKTELSGLVNDFKEAWGHFSKELAALKKR